MSIFYTNISHSQSERPWTVGLGIGNFTSLGDLRSSSENEFNSAWNIGAYTYIARDLTNLLGVELKFFFSEISGGRSFENFQNDISFIGNQNSLNFIYFEGRRIGNELNLSLDISNLFKFSSNKFEIKYYLGLGYQEYYSSVRDRTESGDDRILIDFSYNDSREQSFSSGIFRDYTLNSFYFTTQFGFSYRIITNLYIQFRSSFNVNFEDDLDGVISDEKKKDYFLFNQFGLSLKL